VKGVVDLDRGPGERPRLTVAIDRERSRAFGVKLDDVLQTFQIYLGAYEVTPPLRFGGKESRALRVRVAEPPKASLDDLKLLRVRNEQGAMVPLAAMASFSLVSGPVSVYREGGRYCRVVSCNVQGRDAAAVREEARKAAKGLAGKGVRIEVE
jgi:Cu/Ag efflux pump CusA